MRHKKKSAHLDITKYFFLPRSRCENCPESTNQFQKFHHFCRTILDAIFHFCPSNSSPDLWVFCASVEAWNYLIRVRMCWSGNLENPRRQALIYGLLPSFSPLLDLFISVFHRTLEKNVGSANKSSRNSRYSDCFGWLQTTLRISSIVIRQPSSDGARIVSSRCLVSKSMSRCK